MRKFVKKAAAALLAGTMAMSLAACAGFTPSGGDGKKLSLIHISEPTRH